METPTKAREKRKNQRLPRLPPRVAPFFVGRREILTLDSGDSLETRVRTRPQRFPGGGWRTQVEGREAWYALTKLSVDTSTQMHLELVAP
jgi:hypothetical protein